MAKLGRNDHRPCGSGRKAKRCCGVGGGPGPASPAQAFLAGEARRAAPALAGLSDREFRALFEQLLELPALDLSLVVCLPDLLSPDLDRLLEAVADEDLDAFDEALPPSLAGIDTCERRAQLARAVLELREAGRIAPRLAAAALLALDRGRTLLRASLVQAAAIAAGQARTPAGLLIAA